MRCHVHFLANTKINYNDEEARLVALFDQPPSETEPPPVSTMDSLANTLAEKSQTYNYTTEQGTYSVYMYV